MRRQVLCAALSLLAATAARAEVSVDRVAGEVKLFFAPGPDGPWQRVRAEVPANDVLNEQGDRRGDGWPALGVNAGTQLPEAAWSTGGQGDIHFAAHSGAAWSSAVNLSQSPAAADDLVAFTSDLAGSRYFAWNRTRGERNSVLFAAVSHDGIRVDDPSDLSNRPRALSRPAIAVVGTVVYVAYEEATSHSDNRPVVALDEIRLPRDQDDHLDMSGEIPVDIVRRCTYATHLDAGQPADVRLFFESGDLWLSWLDSPGVRAKVEVTATGCGTPILDTDPTKPRS
jgi:hypothetical protein